MRLAGIAVLLSASLCFAQDTNNFKPATSNVLDAQYPKVDSNSRVQIRRDHRAMAGLSMGGMQTFQVRFNHLDL